MRMWRCYNPKCQPVGSSMPGYDFTSEQPICPSCGISAEHPRYGNWIVPIVVIHFDPPTEIWNQGRNYIACNPNVSVYAEGIQASGSVRAVTCPKCKETEVFREQWLIQLADPTYDIDYRPPGCC